MPKGELENPRIKTRSVTRVYGKKLREAREKRGLHQQEAAELIGVSQATLSRFESGAAQPDWPTFVKMGLAYDCKAVDLMPRNQYPGAPMDPRERLEYFTRRNAMIQGNDPDAAVQGVWDRIYGDKRHDAIGKGS